MRRVVEEWTEDGVRVRTDPLCEMLVTMPEDEPPRMTCSKPATVRVNYWPYWSVFWCPKDAALFRRWPKTPTKEEVLRWATTG